MRLLVVLALASALAAGMSSAVAGKVYHWKDDQGRSHYSDKPPPEAAQSVEEKRVFSGTPDAAQPFSIRKIAQDFPVVFYSAHECAELCVEARALLNGRGIPFEEKPLVTNDDIEAFKGVFGDPVEVPAMTVGKRPLRGFDTGGWNTLLDSVGYPQQPLPKQ